MSETQTTAVTSLQAKLAARATEGEQDTQTGTVTTEAAAILGSLVESAGEALTARDLEVGTMLNAVATASAVEEVVGNVIAEVAVAYKNRLPRIILSDGHKVLLAGGVLTDAMIKGLSPAQLKDLKTQVDYFRGQQILL